MVDELKLNKEKERGAQAEALLRNELLVEAFKILENEYVKAWAATGPDQSAARENIWQALRILSDFHHNFKSVVTNGKLAQRELAELANRIRPRAA